MAFPLPRVFQVCSVSLLARPRPQGWWQWSSLLTPSLPSHLHILTSSGDGWISHQSRLLPGLRPSPARRHHSISPQETEKTGRVSFHTRNLCPQSDHIYYLSSIHFSVTVFLLTISMPATYRTTSGPMSPWQWRVTSPPLSLLVSRFPWLPEPEGEGMILPVREKIAVSIVLQLQ